MAKYEKRIDCCCCACLGKRDGDAEVQRANGYRILTTNARDVSSGHCGVVISRRSKDVCSKNAACKDEKRKRNKYYIPTLYSEKQCAGWKSCTIVSCRLMNMIIINTIFWSHALRQVVAGVVVFITLLSFFCIITLFLERINFTLRWLSMRKTLD